eukprot:SM000239S08057  [mRNA]  locus=s239:189070:193085:+ [translate_table: standard]
MEAVAECGVSLSAEAALPVPCEPDACLLPLEAAATAGVGDADGDVLEVYDTDVSDDWVALFLDDASLADGAGAMVVCEEDEAAAAASANPASSLTESGASDNDKSGGGLSSSGSLLLDAALWPDDEFDPGLLMDYDDFVEDINGTTSGSDTDAPSSGSVVDICGQPRAAAPSLPALQCPGTRGNSGQSEVAASCRPDVKPLVRLPGAVAPGASYGLVESAGRGNAAVGLSMQPPPTEPVAKVVKRAAEPLLTEDETHGDTEAGDTDDKRLARLQRNRESAQLSRQRKKYYMDELEGRLKAMQTSVAELTATVTHLTSENMGLKRQLAYFYQAAGGPGGRPVPGPPLMPMPRGPPFSAMLAGRLLPGQAPPPVPIPRLKTQRSGTAAARKAKAASAVPNGAEAQSVASGEKGNRGTKRLRAAEGATVAMLSLFCFAMFLSPKAPREWLLPRQSTALVGGWEEAWGSGGEGLAGEEAVLVLDGSPTVSSKAGARVLMGFVDDFDAVNATSSGQQWQSSAAVLAGTGNAPQGDSCAGCERLHVKLGAKLGVFRATENTVNSTSHVLELNATQPVPASLMVPRSNGLVQIDGSLIIQAVMAGDKAAKALVQRKEHQLGTDGRSRRPLRVVEMQKLKAQAMVAIEGSGDVDTKRALMAKQGTNGGGPKRLPAAEDGAQLQEWFGGNIAAGSVLSSGMCMEVFQFDASPVQTQETAKSTAAEAAAAASNAVQNRTTMPVPRSKRSRRDLYAMPMPPVGSSKSEASSAAEDGESKEQCRQNRPANSSMVVSVLASPQDVAGATVGSGRLSQIFVVVLVNEVKYVTYSCGLPIVGAAGHKTV